MGELVTGFLLMNLAGAVAVGVVLALRGAVRRGFGARVAYGLWLLVPLALAAAALPARVVTITRPAQETIEIVQTGGASLPAAPAAAHFDAAPWLAALWLAGMLASGLWILRRQAQFGRAMQVGRAGPAVVGVLKPRIVLPADFDARYTPRERQMILAHEATHIARRDPGVNALVAAARCLAWFNPLVHLAARYLRIDQELACDAEVVAAHPQARRTYAEAMLKTQLAVRPLPLGCYWPASGAHPLAQRVGLLARGLPGRRREAGGALAVGLLAVAAAFAVWAARPPQVAVQTIAPTPQAPPVRIAARPAPAFALPTPPRPPAPPRKPTPEAPVQLAQAETAAQPAVQSPLPEEPTSRRPVWGAAERSHVEPGSAVRVLATMTDEDGRHLVTDLTAYGSQAAFRTGRIERDDSRYALYTAVDQQGDRFAVTASLGAGFMPRSSGRITLAAGETGTITLPNGLAVTVTPTVRPETPQDLAAGREALERSRAKMLRMASFARDPFRCGRLGAIC